MSARKKMSLVEIMIMLAILGIFFSIMVPNIERAKRQAEAQRKAPVVQTTTSGEGQFNTIEVSEVSKPVKRHDPLHWVGALTRFLPLILFVVFARIIFRQLRRQMNDRA